MKKIIALIFAAITMMISCAGPLIIKANAASGYPTNFEDWKTYYSSEVTWHNDLHVFFNIEIDNRTDSVCIILPQDNINSGENNSLYCEYANNILIIRGNLNYSDISYYYGDSETGSSHIWSYSCYAFQFDFNTNTGYCLLDDGTKSLSWRGITDFTFTNFETDWDGYSVQEPLDLDITFKPSLSGTISRNTVIDGKDYTSKTLDMYVSNNGSSDAQFAMFIVPRGESISFPDHMIQDNKGFIGNPVFVYVSDEWSSFTAGLVGSSVYAPCSWHTVPKGFQNQFYSISWNQMSLQPDTEYDCVVYGCLNTTATQTNTSSTWEMRPVYTVTSSLDDVEEVYRSSFTITDPAEFNPNFIDEAGASHPWNPNADNSNLFNVASAYRDDNGNVVIKGQTGGGNNIFTADLNTQSMNVNNLFGDTFRFFTALLGQLPPAWVTLITIGLSSIVVIAIVKKVTS